MLLLKISHNECKDVLLNNNYLRYSLNRIQSKNHKGGTSEINKVSLSCFDDKLYVLTNRYNQLLLVIRVDHNLLKIKKNSFQFWSNRNRFFDQTFFFNNFHHSQNRAFFKMVYLKWLKVETVMTTVII